MITYLDTLLLHTLNNLAFNLPTLKYISIFSATALIWLLFFWYVVTFIWHKRSGLRELIYICAIGLAAYLTNQLIALWWFRPRPFVTFTNLHQLIEYPATKSFPSDHATLAFLMAYLLSIHKPEWRSWAYIIATSVALGRVLVGVHYPLDILAGAIIGIIFGLLAKNLIITTTHQNN